MSSAAQASEPEYRKGNNERQMRILVLATHRRAGGAQLIAHDLAGGLSGQGHSVRLRYLYEVRDHPQAPGGPALVATGPRPRAWDYARVVWRLVREIKDFGPNAVITHMPLACVVGQAMAALWQIKGRVAVQHIPPCACKGVMRVLDRLCGMYGVYTTNVAVSNSVLRAFAGWGRAYEARQTVIPNGIDFQKGSGSRDEIRREFGLPLDVPIIVFCGRLTEQKNPEAALEVMPEIRGHLALVGDGNLADQMHRLAEDLGVADRVHFLGHLDRREAQRVLRASDVFVLPSRYEGMSLSLLEALHAGLPIVASRIEANKEVLVDDNGEECGFLLDPEDRRGWREVLMTILEDRELRVRLAQKAADRGRAYALSTMTRAYEAVLTRDLEAHDGTGTGKISDSQQSSAAVDAPEIAEGEVEQKERL